MADVKWIKVSTNMFETNRKIKQIELMPEGDTILVIWLKLMLLAGIINDGGKIYITPEIPYTEEMLANELRRPLTVVRMSLQLFERFGMVEVKNDVIYLSSWEKWQSVDRLAEIREYNRIAKQKSREKQKALESVNDMSMTCQRGHDTDIDKEGDLEKDIKNNSVQKKRTRFSPPTIDEVKAYCKERNNNVDAERFIDYYNSNGWMVGKNKMKDWKAAVRTWENNGYGNGARKQQPKETKSRSYDIEAYERMIYAEENPPKTVADDPKLRKRAESLMQRLVED